MKILLCTDVPPFVVGGAETQSWRLAREWAAMGNQVECVGYRIASQVQNEIRLHRLPLLKRGGRLVRGMGYFFALGLFLLKRRRSYDVVYSRFLGESTLSVVLLKAMRLLRMPLVAVPAAAGHEDNSDLAILSSLPATNGLIRLINRHCDCINFISPAIERDLRSAGIAPGKFRHIPNGVNLTGKTALAPAGHPYRLLFVGRLEYQKGLDILLPVMSRLAAEGHEFELKILGTGSLLGELEEKVVSLGLDGKVHFSGVVDSDQVLEELSRTHLFLLPSRYEGMSNAALEALACGVPCVLSACGGIDSYLDGDTGWVFNLEDVEDLHHGLSQALCISAEEWEIRSRRSRQLVMDNFSMPVVAREYLDLFRELACAPESTV
ncbi:glycosyltransferase family 4 protein [Thiolapillus brandeum]|uniref:Glycosyl transferase family 1 n=1 Tax=Thiolapillus brandeum TaxID=1076588 RepID=A0A7U6GH28_9GAMM|nr:glycosyltransferase family 4 protein [Thiolapillus brandeum]BAO43526.1 glycosyl transferase family 1 [Thiolapillus brandeum]